MSDRLSHCLQLYKESINRVEDERCLQEAIKSLIMKEVSELSWASAWDDICNIRDATDNSDCELKNVLKTYFLPNSDSIEISATSLVISEGVYEILFTATRVNNFGFGRTFVLKVPIITGLNFQVINDYDMGMLCLYVYTGKRKHPLTCSHDPADIVRNIYEYLTPKPV